MPEHGVRMINGGRSRIAYIDEVDTRKETLLKAGDEILCCNFEQRWKARAIDGCARA